jgi:hypothetical protein
MMKQMLEADGMIFLLLTSLIHMEWRCLDKYCLSFKHWTHIRTKYHLQLPNECRHKEEQIKNKIENIIEKMKSEYRHETTLLEEQIGGSGSTWSWFACMITIMKGIAKGRGAHFFKKNPSFGHLRMHLYIQSGFFAGFFCNF